MYAKVRVETHDEKVYCGKHIAGDRDFIIVDIGEEDLPVCSSGVTKGTLMINGSDIKDCKIVNM